VYEGFHKETGEKVAIKVIPIRKLEREQNPRAREYLNQEIAIMKAARHENIMTLFAYYTSMDNSYVYLVMEHCNCGDLAGLIRQPKYKKMPEELARDLVTQLAAGLRCLRHLSVVHRDLKPQNLMLSEDPAYLATHPESKFKLIIADFGLARQIKTTSLTYSIVGSPRYMAPEILSPYATNSRKSYTVSADLWSVGVIMFELLMGEPPFAQAHDPRSLLNLIDGTTTVTIPLEGSLSTECCDLLRRLLQKDPDRRITWTQFFAHPWLKLDHIPHPTSIDIDTATHDPSRPSRTADSDTTASTAIPVCVYPREPKPPVPVGNDDVASRSTSDPRRTPDSEEMRKSGETISLLTESIRTPSVKPFRDSVVARDSPLRPERPNSRASEDSFEREMVLIRSQPSKSGSGSKEWTIEKVEVLKRKAAGAAAISGLGHDYVRMGQTVRGLCLYRLGLRASKQLLQEIEVGLRETSPTSVPHHELISFREKLEDYFLYYLTEIRSTQCWSSPDVDPSYADAFLKAMQLAGYGATEENVRNFEKCITKYRIALGILEVLHGYATVLSDAENIAKYIGYVETRMQCVNASME